MLQRHQNALTDLLEQVAYEGSASVAKWRLTRWYGQDRFSVNIRRDLRARWEAMQEELHWTRKQKLVLAEVKDQIVMMHSQIFFADDE